MSDLYWRTEERMERLCPFFAQSHGRPWVNDLRVLSGIIFVNRNGLYSRDSPRDYGPGKTLYSRWKCRGDAGVLVRMLEGQAVGCADPRTVMIDATYLDAHCTASSLAVKKGGASTIIGRPKGGRNAKLHTLADANGRPLSLFLTAGPVSDHTGAAALLDNLCESA